MRSNVERLRERFADFRSPTKAASEKAYIDTVVKIAKYVEGVASIDDIKKDFSSSKSAIYQGFDEYDKRILGAILFGKLTVDDYIKNNLPDANSEERKLLSELSEIVGGLYSDATGNRGKLDDLYSKTYDWIQNYATTAANKEDARELCCSLYTMLACFNVKINNLSFVEKSLGGNLVTKAIAEIGKLLSATEAKIKQLDEQPAPQALETEGGKVKTMDDHLNERFHVIFNNDDDLDTKLTQLINTSTELSTDTNQLITKKQERMDLENDIQMIEALLKATSVNDAQITGRKYFLQLVADNKAQFDRLMDRLEEPDKSKFKKDMEPIQTPSASDANVSTALYVMSWLTSPATIVARSVTPQVIQDNFNSLLPDTQDSLCKRELKTFAQSTLQNLREKLQVVKSDTAALEDKIAAGNSPLKAILQKADKPLLQKIVTANNVTLEVLQEYRKFMAPIKNTRAKLHQMQYLDKSMDSFIQANDRWYMKLGDFFSRMPSLWKTESLSEKLALAQTCKSALSNIQTKYNTELAEQMTKFDENPEISTAVKESFKSRLKEEVNANGNSTVTATTAARQLAAIKTQMQALRDQHKLEPITEEVELVRSTLESRL